MNEDVQNTEVNVQPQEVQQSVQSTVTDSQPVQEKMIPQSQVSKIAAREAREASEKTRNEMQAEFDRRSAATQSQVPQQQSIGGMQQQSPDDIRRLIQEEAYKMSNLAMAQRIEQEFKSKVDAAKDKYPDAAEKIDKLKLDNHPQLVLWAHGMDNTGEIVKDIAENPTKLANILMLANSGFPDLAHQEMHKLSASIKANEVAQQQKQVNEPLDQLSPSTISTGDGSLTVADFRKMFRG